jgi:hypothetical protein
VGAELGLFGLAGDETPPVDGQAIWSIAGGADDLVFSVVAIRVPVRLPVPERSLMFLVAGQPGRPHLVGRSRCGRRAFSARLGAPAPVR